MEKEEMIEEIGEGVVNNILTEEVNSVNKINGLAVIGTLCLIGASGYGIYRLIKNFKKKHSYVELTPNDIVQIKKDNDEENEEE